MLMVALLAPAFAAETAPRAPVAADASRIVAIGGTVTEVLYALGLEDSVVGVDLTSDFPERAAEKPKVGYMRALSAEGVLALAPTLILAIEDAGPPETIAVLESASVAFVRVPKPGTAGEVADTIRLIADTVGVPDKGAALASAVSADLATVAAMLAEVDARRRAVFVLGLNGGAPLAAGSDTAAADVFALARIDNALAGMQGYKPVSDEAGVAAAPDAVVLMADQTHGLSDDVVLAAPAFAGTPAARDGRLIRVSGSYLLNFGPRTAHAVRDLAAALYPELALPALPERPWTADAGGRD